jgi:hypothetical protein
LLSVGSRQQLIDIALGVTINNAREDVGQIRSRCGYVTSPRDKDQLGCVGVTVSSCASWTRRQSSPSSSADNCAADNFITPFSIFGKDTIFQPLGETDKDRFHPRAPANRRASP